MATHGLYLALFLLFCATANGFHNGTSKTHLALRKAVYRGQDVFLDDELFTKLKEESGRWHWLPWQRTRAEVVNGVLTKKECVGGDSIDSFPDGFLTDDQLRDGGFAIYILFGVYAFTLLAFVCNDYFIPSVELICENLNIPQDVAAATFMSVATSCPEFFVNLISTFITASDMGIGTIIGSAIFNALGVAAIGGIAASRPIPIEMRPVTRDVIVYMVNVSVLVAVVWDGQVDWYEALVLGIMYVLYFLLMFNSVKLFRIYDNLVARCKGEDISVLEDESGKVSEGIDNPALSVTVPTPEIVVNGLQIDKVQAVDSVDSVKEDDDAYNLWRYPSDKKLKGQIWWMYSWPLKFLLGMTIPSPKTCKKWYPLTFTMCIVWIGVNSYFVTWCMTVIGFSLFIPDSVMGMTFLAFGGCLPEACAIFIMSRRGEGGMGVSNALGANSLAILFALGLPWLIRTMTLLAQDAAAPVVEINSSGIEFIVGSLLVAVISLWITLFFGKFILKKLIGAVLSCLYVVFVTFAILVEMGYILDREIPLC